MKYIMTLLFTGAVALFSFAAGAVFSVLFVYYVSVQAVDFYDLCNALLSFAVAVLAALYLHSGRREKRRRYFRLFTLFSVGQFLAYCNLNFWIFHMYSRSGTPLVWYVRDAEFILLTVFLSLSALFSVLLLIGKRKKKASRASAASEYPVLDQPAGKRQLVPSHIVRKEKKEKKRARVSPVYHRVEKGPLLVLSIASGVFFSCCILFLILGCAKQLFFLSPVLKGYTVSYTCALAQETEDGYEIIAAEEKQAGKIRGIDTQYVLRGTRAYYVVAEAKSGYRFLCWSDGKTSAGRKDTPTSSLDVQAIFVVDSDLPVVQIYTENSRAVYSKTSYVTCFVSLNETEETEHLFSCTAQIRVRGNSTSGPDKKPYKIKLDQSSALLKEGAASKQWVLLAEYFDVSLLRNSLSLYMGNRLNIGFCSSFAYTEVYLNGAYAGVYLLCESVDTGEGKVEITEDDTLETGYLVELDGYAESEDGQEGIDWFAVTYKGSRLVYSVKGEVKSAAQVQQISSDILALYAVADGGTRAEAEEIADVASIVDFYILQAVADDPDCNWSSMYLAKDKDGKIAFTAPWDFDLSYGNYDDCENPATDYTNYLLSLFGQQEWFMSLVRARWQELTEEGFFDDALAYIRDTQTRCASAFERNDKRYALSAQYAYMKMKLNNAQTDMVLTFSDHNDAIDYLYTWLQSRLSTLSARYAAEAMENS